MSSSSCFNIYEKCIGSNQVSDDELQKLLTCRDNNELDFLLVDIRELFEYSEKSVSGTNLLLPTSNFHEYIKLLEDKKDKFILLYCRSGRRTADTLRILKRMGFERIAHLSKGIIEYSGKKLRNATIPNEL